MITLAYFFKHMFIEFQKSLLSQKDELRSITAIASSLEFIAVATSDQFIHIFDKQYKKDKIQLKAADQPIPFYVTCMQFYEDKLAVGQSDGGVFLYRLQEKKVICNKFISSVAISHLYFNNTNYILYCTIEGKIKLGNLKSNKAGNMYQGQFINAFTVSKDMQLCWIAQPDGTILRLTVGESPQQVVVKKFEGDVTSLTALDNMMVVLNESKIHLIQLNGNSLHSTIEASDIFSVSIAPNEQYLVYHTNTHVFLLDLTTFTKQRLPIDNIHFISSIHWSLSGILVGTMDGLCDQLLLVSRFEKYKDQYEIKYHVDTSATVKRLTDSKVFTLATPHPIQYLEILQHVIVCKTTQMLLFLNTTTNITTSIEWHRSSNDEQFILSPLMVVAENELSIIDNNRIVASITDHINYQSITMSSSYHIAYLLDSCTIVIKHMGTQSTFTNDIPVSHLYMQPSGAYLCFKDINNTSYLFNLKTNEKQVLLHNCILAAWIGDVLVCQSGMNAHIYYTVSNVHIVPLTANITQTNSTSIVLADGTVVPVQQKTSLVELLKHRSPNYTLQVALEQNNSYIASLCYFELKDYAKGYTSRQNIKNRTVEEWLNLHQYTKALNQLRSSPNFESMKSTLINRLLQETRVLKAAQVLHDLLLYKEALQLYLKCKLPLQAYPLCAFVNDSGLIIDTADLLHQQQYYEYAGDLYVKYKPELAIQNYKKCHAYLKLLPLVQDKASVQVDYATHLLSTHQYTDALPLLIELNDSRAFSCAIKCREWQTAFHLCKPATAPELAVVLESNGEHVLAAKAYALYSVHDAIRVYCSIGLYQEAANLGDCSDIALQYLKSGNSQQFIQLQTFVNPSQLASMLFAHGFYDESVEQCKKHSPQSLPALKLKIGEYYASIQQYDKAEAYLDTKHAIIMYLQLKQFQSALRLAQHTPYLGQVAYAMGSAIDPSLIPFAVEYALKQEDYAFALQYSKSDQTLVKYAMYLEGNGNIKEAHQYYIQSKHYAECVEMHMSKHDYTVALQVCQQYMPGKVNEIIEYQLQKLFREKQYALAEQLGLKAMVQDMVIRLYEGEMMLQQALQFAQSYAQNKVGELQTKYKDFIKPVKEKVKEKTLEKPIQDTGKPNKENAPPAELPRQKDVLPSEEPKLANMQEYLTQIQKYDAEYDSLLKKMVNYSIDNNKVEDLCILLKLIPKQKGLDALNLLMLHVISTRQYDLAIYFLKMDHKKVLHSVMLLLHSRQVARQFKDTYLDMVISLSLLKYADYIGYEVGFYDAGMAAKAININLGEL